MFVFTVKTRLSRKQRFLIFIGAACAVVLIVTGVVLKTDTPKDTAVCDSIGEYSLVADDYEAIQEFAGQFSLETLELYSQRQVYIPSTFDDTYNKYNSLQKRQGLDLEKYRGRECTLYIYKLKDYTIEGAHTYISIIVYKDRVIGGHISTGVQDSPMYTFFGD